jgi:hypothetical protein
VYESPHYRLHTDVSDTAAVERLLERMEVSYLGYARLIAPRAAPRLMELFVFAQWDDFAVYTRQTTGRDYKIYLSVGHGGYCIEDRFVCYFGNEPDVLAVAAHEGFHQYVYRHALTRLPPALEEGLATTFETTDRTQNPRRQTALQQAFESDQLIPLATLVQSHAGDVAGQSVELNETFYAQCWALARMLETDPVFSAAFKQMLTDITRGNLLHNIGRGTEYKPGRVIELLTQSLHQNWPTIEQQYIAYIRASSLSQTQ